MEVVMDQCSFSLQRHVKAENDYNSHIYDEVLLLQTQKKKVTSGVTHQ